MPDPRSLLEVGLSGGLGMSGRVGRGMCRGYVQRVRMGMYTPSDMGPGIPTCPGNDT